MMSMKSMVATMLKLSPDYLPLRFLATIVAKLLAQCGFKANVFYH